MSTELIAVRDLLAATTGVPSHLGDASGKLPPFTVVWGPPGLADADATVAPNQSHRATFGVTCTGQDTQAALDLADLVIAQLYPGQEPTVIPGVPGRHVTCKLYDARPVDVDRTVALTSTAGAHPAFVVLMGHLHSQPAPIPQEQP